MFIKVRPDERADMRTYELVQVDTGWQLTLYIDGEEVGGGGGGPDDYEFLLEQAKSFCGE